MATTFLGAVSLADAFPGFAVVLTPLRQQLSALRQAAQTALAAVNGARLTINESLTLSLGLDAQLGAGLDAHIASLKAFKLGIRALALADLEVQLQAAIALEASLSVTVSDPTAYIAGLISAVGSVQIDLSQLVPSVSISAQLSAAVAMRLEVAAKIAAFDLALDAINAIIAALVAVLSAVIAVLNQLGALMKVAVQAMLSLSASLSVSIDATAPALEAAVALEAQLTGGPVEMARYDGPRSGLGSSVDAALAASSSIPAGDNVRAWLLVAPDSSPTVQARLGVLLKTS